MGENSDGDAGSTLSTDASESEDAGTDEDSEESPSSGTGGDSPSDSNERNSQAEADGGSDAPDEETGVDDSVGASDEETDTDDGTSPSSEASAPTGEYEVSSDYEILPEGTDESDVEAEDEYDYAADASLLDGDRGGEMESGDSESGDSESSDSESSDANPEGRDDSSAESETDEEFREESDGGETASGSGMMAYESPDVSLDPDELDPDDDGFDPDDDLESGHEDPHEPVQDEEMPLAAHIEEMVKRLAVVVLVAGAVSLIVFLTPIGNGTAAERSINFLWDSVLPADTTTRPTVYGPLSLIMTEFKVASLAGVIIAMPVLVYESYQFMKPGLYPHERRYYLAAVPTSLVLAVVGVAFAYRPVLPLLFQYFFRYTRDVTEPAFGLSKTFNLILAMMGYFAVIFQIPLFIMLAIMMGVTTREWLASRRLYFWGAFLGMAFFFVAVDPTGVAPILIAGTMILLFEGTLFLLKWTGS